MKNFFLITTLAVLCLGTVSLQAQDIYLGDYPPPAQYLPIIEEEEPVDLMRFLIESTPPPEPPLAQQPITFTTTRPTGLFRYPGAATPSSALSPQTVRVLEEDGYWRQIQTWMGPMWIYENFTPPTAAIDTFLSRFPNTAVFFYNMDTGFTYSRNGNRQFFGASISKASYALYLYQRAERGEIDLNRHITYTSADWNGGSGIIRHRYRVGQTFTVRRTIQLNLYHSDNIATNMLRRTFGTQGYRNWLYSIGGTPSMFRYRIFNSQLTANEVGLFAQEIWRYYQSGGRYSEEFMRALLNNQYPFIVSDYPVASKTGWTAPIAWHDMAIVHAPSPYILVILSQRQGWRPQDYRDFAEISMFFQEFNNRWF